MADEKKETTEKSAAAPQKKQATGKPKNCVFCNKALRRKSWYYRNSKYYCRKKCWQEECKKLEKAAEK